MLTVLFSNVSRVWENSGAREYQILIVGNEIFTEVN